MMFFGFVPTIRLEPISAVMGRSVDSRSVRHGTLRMVVSSCMPPESVSTIRAEAVSLRKSMYPTGSIIRRLGMSAREDTASVA